MVLTDPSASAAMGDLCYDWHMVFAIASGFELCSYQLLIAYLHGCR